MRRTFVIGDIHGDSDALRRLLGRLPPLDEGDTLVFLGDYVDRGPDSKGVVAIVRSLPDETPARVVALRGNHEDAWLRVIDRGWPEFTIPPANGCLATLRSFLGSVDRESAVQDYELRPLLEGSFFPADVVAWMRSLPFYYEDEHAIYVHAGLPRTNNAFPHPSEVETKTTLLWCRDAQFFRSYRGKLVVFGHTATELLPPELSMYTPEDPADLWAGPSTIGLDTGCGKGGFLTGLELPSLLVYESR